MPAEIAKIAIVREKYPHINPPVRSEKTKKQFFVAKKPMVIDQLE